VQIHAKEPVPAFALFELGFRPFFAAAGLFAVVVTGLWMGIYVFGEPWAPTHLSTIYWHGHEMVFGFAMAVVAGFLLTAVVNWTGRMTPRRAPLALLVALWLVGRVAFFLPFDDALLLAAFADVLFMLGLIVGVSVPVWQVRQWKQLGILSKLWLMLAANLLFYAGAFGWLDNGMAWGLHGGLYLLVALVFVMGRRVIPFFIQRGVDEDFTPRNRDWIDIASLVLFLAWTILVVFMREPAIVAWLSLALLLMHALRLYDWHTPGIWRKPLLWSLYLGYGFLLLGFALQAASHWFGVAPTLAMHAFAVGGVGLVTIAMMARVALGHSGRNVFEPPPILAPIFALVVAGALVRVVAPLLAPALYVTWVGASQVLWIVAFGLFSLHYLPILARPRVDGRAG
jgi:uncharacterized protein involved in response to NO